MIYQVLMEKVLIKNILNICGLCVQCIHLKLIDIHLIRKLILSVVLMLHGMMISLAKKLICVL